MTAAADSCQHLQSSAAEVNTIFRPATEAKAGLGAVRHEEASTAGLENGVTQRSTEAAAARLPRRRQGPGLLRANDDS